MPCFKRETGIELHNLNELESETQVLTDVENNISIESNSCLGNRFNKYLLNIKNWFIDNFNRIYGNYLHVYFIIVFEILFYFNYVVDIESDEIKRVLDSFSTDIKKYMPDYINNLTKEENNELFQDMCHNLTINHVDKNNALLKEEAYNVIWALSTCLIIIIMIHFRVVNDKNIFFVKTLEAIIFIGVIAIFEYYFFTEIITKYHIMNNDEASCYLYNNIFE
ncbi:hypothetical protein CPAV1605_465 [seawater metagenome]|uniref:Uncharacterized protein n=1 Tax=seawater metagenome TaxID=1561972 RepID=A0A5E8CM18_9ZZZZ